MSTQIDRYRRLGLRAAGIVLSPGDWQRVKGAEPVTVRGSSYVYDEERFGDIWRFHRPEQRHPRVRDLSRANNRGG